MGRLIFICKSIILCKIIFKEVVVLFFSNVVGVLVFYKKDVKINEYFFLNKLI